MNIDKQALRERYSLQPAPKCHICGAEMTIQRMSASRITYGCTGATYDDKGCHYAEGRSIADDHYAQSRVTVVDVSDPDVLALLDENIQLQRGKDSMEAVALALRDDMQQAREQLAAAERRNAELDKRLIEYAGIATREARRVAEQERANAAQDDHINQQQDRIDVLERRSADLGKYAGELESRTVTLEPFRSFVTNDDIAALHRFAECCDDPESGGHDLEIEQVRRLEAIGALQRSGRVSYITGFGDVLISITAGIKVKGE
ncbi:TPA: ead/Ea22-like family protein [Salmonella enterica subsp. enterica serovar Eastbourne]